MPVRLQKFIAEAGIASRRGAEQLIQAGRVRVNGSVIRTMGVTIDPDHDQVAVDHKVIHRRPKFYVALNKPRGYICSRKDPEGRPSVYQLLPPQYSSLYTVGRLDMDSEGLLFLTNDGQFSLRLTHPRYGIRKVYLAWLDRLPDPVALNKIVKGVFHEGELLRAEKASLWHAEKGQVVVRVELTEGKNREVRRLFEAQAFTVKRLERVQIGTIKLGRLAKGKWRTLTESERKSLLST